ncbi:ZAR1-like protein [Sebastes umbrosus]|uniref:ZAR1-like protein n=1 Tax=Sebastes umbrosus TaxID=72105 RepID=UPI00189D6B80|nr:ZAR1-like protein [Sebastes umbrosus]
MEGFLSTFPPHNVCSEGGWGKREGRFMTPQGLNMTPQGLNYLELCRAIILAQVSPALPHLPPLKRANTRECGVQVNAKVDKVVQCSLGPKTLFCSDCDQQKVSSKSPEKDNTSVVSQLRFLRPVSIYSPVFDRRLFMKKLCHEDGSEGEAEQEAEQAESDRDDDETDHSEEEEEEEEAEEEDTVKDFKTTFNKSTKGSNFQFLEQRYGFFHCKKCNVRWESAYVWCISGTSKVYYKQLCRKCQVGFNPYRVESILCKGCSQTCCSCEKKQRHINMKRPHRQDLCCRCKGMRLSCDATYSFKYIV